MPRGSADFSANDKDMNKSRFVKISDKPQTFYLEGIGDARQGRYGMECPIFVVTEDLEPCEITANGNLYRAFRAAEVSQWDMFTIYAVKEAVMDDRTGEQAKSESGEDMYRNVYTITKTGKSLSPEERRKLISDSEEVNIDDIPF